MDRAALACRWGEAAEFAERGALWSERPGFAFATSDALRHFPVHQSEADGVFGRVHQFGQFVEFAEYLQRTREGLHRDIGCMRLCAPNGH